MKLLVYEYYDPISGLRYVGRTRSDINRLNNTECYSENKAVQDLVKKEHITKILWECELTDVAYIWTAVHMWCNMESACINEGFKRFGSLMLNKKAEINWKKGAKLYLKQQQAKMEKVINEQNAQEAE